MTNKIEYHKDCFICEYDLLQLEKLTDDEKLLVDHMYEIHDRMTTKYWISRLVIARRKENVQLQVEDIHPTNGFKKGLFLK